jgi:3-dehydroquinate synthase
MRDFDLEYQVPGDLDLDDLIEAMSRDKKMEAGKLKFILPKDRLGHAIVVKAIDNKLVKAALRSNQANG